MAFAEKRGARWRAGWWGTDAAGNPERHYKASFDTKRDALDYGAEQEALERAGIVVRKAGSFGEWAELWMDARQTEAGTHSSDVSRQSTHILPRWADTDLADIEPMAVQRWVSRELPKAGLAPGTIIRVYGLFSSCLGAAVRARRLPITPCQAIKLPAVGGSVMRFLDDDELAAVMAELDHKWRIMATILVGTGLRFGELAGLHWQHVDLAARRLKVVDTYDSVGRVIKGYTKSRQARTVPLPASVLEALGEAEEITGGRSRCNARHANGARCRSGLVLPNSVGTPLDHRLVRPRHWLPACQRAGLDGVRLHDCRHTYASRLLQHGATLERVQLLLGHSSIRTTERYAFLMPDRFDDVLAAVESAFPTARPVPLRAVGD